MRVNVFVDDVSVGSRVGCDVLLGDVSCAKSAVSAPLFYEGQPRDICESCLALMTPGKPLPTFRSSHYDTVTENHRTTPALELQATPEAATSTPEPPPPAFPSCPKCGERDFAVSQNISESRVYAWEPSAFRFGPAGEPAIEQKTVHSCAKCGEIVPQELLAAWIS